MLFAGALHAQSSANRPDAPKTFQPPADQVLLLHLQGKGNQIYVCETSADGAPAWKFKAPEAKLYSESGELLGRVQSLVAAGLPPEQQPLEDSSQPQSGTAATNQTPLI